MCPLAAFLDDVRDPQETTVSPLFVEARRLFLDLTGMKPSSVSSLSLVKGIAASSMHDSTSEKDASDMTDEGGELAWQSLFRCCRPGVTGKAGI